MGEGIHGSMANAHKALDARRRVPVVRVRCIEGRITGALCTDCQI